MMHGDDICLKKELFYEMSCKLENIMKRGFNDDDKL